jgi:hypothetical protein
MGRVFAYWAIDYLAQFYLKSGSSSGKTHCSGLKHVVQIKRFILPYEVRYGGYVYIFVKTFSSFFFLKLQKLLKFVGLFFSAENMCINFFYKNALGYILGDFIHNRIWSPWFQRIKRFRFPA